MSTRPARQGAGAACGEQTRPRKRLELAEIGIRLLDEAHVAWQRAELECERALRAWYDGSPRTSADRYLAYRAALDREHAAAHDLERLWELARSSGTTRSRGRGRRRPRNSMYQAGAWPLLWAYTILDVRSRVGAHNRGNKGGSIPGVGDAPAFRRLSRGRASCT